TSCPAKAGHDVRYRARQVESSGVLRFSLRLVRPYWTWLVLVLGAMLLETAMSLASPWPLKIVLDSVIDSRPMPAWLAGMVGSTDRLALLNVAVGGTVVIALLQAASAYL